MALSIAWLTEWVGSVPESSELEHRLTMAGLEVKTIKPAAESFQSVVIGQVVDIKPHPQADRLQVATVDVGNKAHLTIVCGAKNICVEGKFPVALVGASLPNGVAIKKTKLRSVTSEGMLCSSSELGLGEGAEGIWLLDPAAVVGTALWDYLQLDDHILDLEITPNRGDCLSVLGVARELAAISGTRLPETWPLPLPAAATVDRASAVVTAPAITVEVPDLCPAYWGCAISGIRAGVPTPVPMQERLRRSGVRAIHPVVDIANYLMFAVGQPMHAFDRDKLGEQITIRYAQAGESIDLLNEQTVKLQPDTLVIADEHRVHAIAGVMGAAYSAVTENTTNLFLEAAFFTPEAVAGQARRYGLSSDSAYRFERGVDLQLPEKVMEYAYQTIVDTVGGRAEAPVGVVSLLSQPTTPAIRLRRARMERILGVAIADKQVVSALEAFGCSITEIEEGWTVGPPSYRFDLQEEIDLIEEVMRAQGYDHLPVTVLRTQVAPLPVPETIRDKKTVVQRLITRGYQEVITFSFIGAHWSSLLPHATAVQAIKLKNPISSEMECLRTSLWAGLLEAAVYNQHRQEASLRFCELGLTFMPEKEGLKQPSMLAGLIIGSAHPKQWSVSDRPVDFFDIKADVEALLPSAQFVKTEHPSLHPGVAARVVLEDEPVGFVGQLHPQIQKTLKLTQPVFLFELSVAPLLRMTLPQAALLSKFPSIRRDIALLVPQEMPYAKVAQKIQESSDNLLKSVQLFDIYSSEELAQGQQSFALRLVFQEKTRTLLETEVTERMAAIIAALENDLGVRLRDGSL